ncbi:hypothetical protein [Butyrivibrio sp. MC2013]|uniref:hypothetical protein n=1 Tax=Butyrivibrio sp. MC2013 TaxID=1280686 RepID=UPI00047BD80B|nr:hypothetical protein [Butyrivibrio sp. MC2013]
MKKAVISVLTLTVVIALFVNISIVSIASTPNIGANADSTNFELLQIDPLSPDYKFITQYKSFENGRITIKKIYRDASGSYITDISDIPVGSMSKNGSDSVTRKRIIQGYATVTLKASFQWKTEGMFSYVKCKSMSASYKLESGISSSQNKWITDKTTDYVSIGSAYAKVSYHFYKTKNWASYKAGTFKITCTDTGSISDNG